MAPNEAILMTKTVMRTENGTKSIHSHDNLKIVMRTRKTVQPTISLCREAIAQPSAGESGAGHTEQYSKN